MMKLSVKIVNIIIYVETMIYEWIKHFLWLVGWMTKCFLQGDWENTVETFFWLKIHLTYRCSSIESFKINREQMIENFAVRLLGATVIVMIILIVIHIWEIIVI